MDVGEGTSMGSVSSGGTSMGSAMDVGFAPGASDVSFETGTVSGESQSFQEAGFDPEDQTSMDEFVAAPATPHDKLSLLSQMADEKVTEKEKEQLTEENEARNDNPTVPEQASPAKDYMNKTETDEQKLIRLQQDTLKMIVGMMSGDASAKEKEKEMKEMIAELKALLENLAAQGGEKGGLAGSAVSLMLLLLTVGAQAEQKMQREVEAA